MDVRDRGASAPEPELPLTPVDQRDPLEGWVTRRAGPRLAPPRRESRQALRDAICEKSLARLSLHFVDFLLRDPEALFEQIHGRQDLPRVTLAVAILAATLASLYGVAMGSYNGWQQGLSSAVKLPILLLLTAVLCVPSLYVFNVLLGQRLFFLQTAALFSASTGTMTILLGSLAPIVAFFTWTSNDYAFLKLMHVTLFAVCGMAGAKYLYSGCSFLAVRNGETPRRGLMLVWLLLYAVVSAQLGWVLRPFIGARAMPFQLLREAEGNFFLAVLQAGADLLR